MHKFLVTLLTIFCFIAPAKAQNNNFNFNEWSSLPVLYDGRLMPIDSFSNIIFEKISGDKVKNANALLANVIFEPENAIYHPIFKIADAERFELNSKELYDFTVVSKIITDNKETIDKLLLTPEKNLSIEQRHLLELFANYGLYNQLLRAMTGLIPLNIQGEENPQTYFELSIKNDLTVPPVPEAKILKAAASNNIIFKVIPDNEEKTNFITPWEALHKNKPNSENFVSLLQWQSTTMAYRAQHTVQWNTIIEHLLTNSSLDVMSTVKLEKKYNDLSLVKSALILFLLSLFTFILSEWLKKPILTKISFAFLGLGSVAITLDVILRIIITHRPPVGTLYESILFATIITCLTAFLYCLRNINKTALFIGSVSGIILLLMANSFVGIDSFSPLVAVLNTDFWLATHVIIITAGYGFCILVSLYAHIIMWNQDYNKKRTPYKNMNVLVILSLLFVTVGTILGGLWADQSWGRFWGWDPKENGALLIALWIIWLLHGKITHDMSTRFYMAGMAFLSVIVALAWFGVNLLSVGLHSYGFISGIAFGLGTFCATETVLITYLLFFRKRQVS